MIQLTEKEYNDLLAAKDEAARLKSTLVDAHDQLSGALITTGPAQSIMIAQVIEIIHKGLS